MWLFITNRTLLKQLFHMEERLMSVFNDLAAQVAKNNEVIDSAIVLIQGLAQKLQDALNSATPVEAVQGVIDALKAEDAKLADAIAAVPQ